MLKKLFLNTSIQLKNVFNSFKFANFSRKISKPEKNFDKPNFQSEENLVKSIDNKKSLKPKNIKSNYIDIDNINQYSNVKITQEQTKSKEVAKKHEMEDTLKDKNINIIKEEVIIKINPYFPNAVSEKEKSYTNIDTGKLDETKKSKKETNIKDANSIEILKNKRVYKKKIAAGRKASLFMQNIKRELPDEL